MSYAETLDQVNNRLSYLAALPDMTDNEREEYERLSAWSKAMTGEGQRRIDANTRAGRIRRKGNRLTDDDPPPQRVFIGSEFQYRTDGIQPPRVAWTDIRTGNPVRVVGPAERLASDYAEDEQQLSVGRLIRGLTCGNWRGAELEKKAVTEGGSGGGHFLVPEVLSAMTIDLARNNSVLIRAGAQSIPMDSDLLRVARVLADPTFETKAEGAKFTGSDVTFDAVQFVPKLVGTIITLSREVAEDAPNSAQLIEDVLGRSLGVAIDKLGLTGTGSAEINGLINTPGISSTGSVGAILWDDFHTAAVGVRLKNYEPNAYVLNPDIAGDLDLITSGDGTNSARLWLGPPPSLAGVQRLATNSIATTSAAVGDFTQCAFGFRTQTIIETTTEAQEAFERHQLKIKLTVRFDFAVLRTEAFWLLTGITT